MQPGIEPRTIGKHSNHYAYGPVIIWTIDLTYIWLYWPEYSDAHNLMKKINV